MLSDNLRRKLLAIGTVIMPVLLVKATAVYFDAPGPRSVSAVAPAGHSAGGSGSSSGMPSGAWERDEPERERSDLHQYLIDLRRESFGPAPFYYRPARSARQPAEPDEKVSEELPAVVEAPPLRVTVGAIMASQRGHIALIDGRPYRVGDEVAAEWIVFDIDASVRAVTFRHGPTGEMRTKEVPLGR